MFQLIDEIEKQLAVWLIDCDFQLTDEIKRQDDWLIDRDFQLIDGLESLLVSRLIMISSWLIDWLIAILQLTDEIEWQLVD